MAKAAPVRVGIAGWVQLHIFSGHRVANETTTESVDVIFNNHYKAQAVVNAVQFKALLEGMRFPNTR